MRYCRFQFNGQAQYGLVESVAGRDSIVRILVTPPEEADGDMESLRTRRIEAIALEEAALLPPVRPSKIVCVGRNYKEHAAELGNEVPKEPLIFFKPPSALLSPGGVVRRPKSSQRVDFEGELGVVIGKTCFQPAADVDIRQFILGYTCVNDVTARDLQKTDGQWTRAKGFDTFCPVGPVVVTEGIDPSFAAGEYARFYFFAGYGDPVYRAGDDAVSGGFDSDGNAGGRRSGGCRRCDGSGD